MAVDYAKLDSRMSIEIISVAMAHPPLLADILARFGQHYTNSARKVTITCREPERDGMLHYGVLVEYLNGSTMTMGALRRTQDEETEYHS